MKTFLRYALFLLLVPSLLLTGCKDENTPEEVQFDAYQTLTDHLKSTGMDLDHVIKSAEGVKFVMGAPADGDVSGKYVMDIRSSEAFLAGHIEGAVNVAFSDILSKAADADKPILVVCYTGQTACYATALLRLYGYHDAQALKWGMSGWSSSTDSWTGKVANIAEGNSNWSYGAAPEAVPQDAPSFTTPFTDGAAILQERVEAVVAAGFKAINASDVLDNPTGYFINNYFSEAHYTGYGHIEGAYCINPLLLEEGIGNIDPNKQVVTYCYTGQTSAVITAYLNVLGFDAYSLKFGMNGLYNSNSFWDDPEILNQWGADSNPKDLPLVQ